MQIESVSQQRDCHSDRVAGKTTNKKAASKKAVKFKKAPQAPRRFKSAYMFFSTAKHPEIRAKITDNGKTATKTTEVAKLVSKAWKNLSKEDRKEWDEMARKDKARFELEKSVYTGPWKVPKRKGSDRDPNEPKRPMSSFLSFSNSRRAGIKEDYPNKSNADISRILAQKWKEAPEEERNIHIEKEKKLREQYKIDMAQYKKDMEEEAEVQRVERENAIVQYEKFNQHPHPQHDEHQTGATYNPSKAPVPSSGYAGGYPHPDYGAAAPTGQPYPNHYSQVGAPAGQGLASYYPQTAGDGGPGSGSSTTAGANGEAPPGYHPPYGQQGHMHPSYYHPSYGYHGSYGSDYTAGGQQSHNKYNNYSGAGGPSNSGYGYYPPRHYGSTDSGYAGTNGYSDDPVTGGHYHEASSSVTGV